VFPVAPVALEGMPRLITTTYRTFIDRLLALGILSSARVEEAQKGASGWGDLDEEFLSTGVGALLDDLCVAAHLSYEPQDTVADLESSYQRLLQRLAALDGGPVEITDVTLDPEAADLRFRWDGEPVSWYVEPYALNSEAAAVSPTGRAADSCGPSAASTARSW
jgi:hypothetical protein